MTPSAGEDPPGLADEAARLAEAAESWAARRGVTLDGVVETADLAMTDIVASVMAAWRDLTGPDRGSDG